MTQIMNQYDLFNSNNKSSAFGNNTEAGDFSSFINQAAFGDLAAPLFGSTSTNATSPGIAAFADAFRAQDALLDSPLGLSPTTSPFDPTYDFTSPMVSGLYSSSIEGLATPELSDSNELPSLFYSAPLLSEAVVAAAIPALVGNSPLWSSTPDAVVVPPTSTSSRAATPDLIVSPQMMRLDSMPAAVPPIIAQPALDFTVSSPPTVVVETAAAQPAAAAAASKKRKASDVPAVLPHEGREVVKDRFTGCRNTTIPAIDFNAPTMSRQYVIPSVTSRRKAPAAITAKIQGKKRVKREDTPGAGSSTSSALTDAGEEGMDPSELPDELLSAIELKRRQNTLAARRSRMRKATHIQGLEDEIDRLKREVEQWKAKCAALEAAQ
ncbi:hypothetical protein T439DRAFT_325309 [Meredithblackwellia eburnea MCA 4105]